MKRKIWVLGACIIFLLTGCGTPDAVADELKHIPAGFKGSEADVAEVVDAIGLSQYTKEPCVVSEKMRERANALYECLVKMAHGEVIEVSGYGEDWDEEDAELGEQKVEGPEEYLSEIKIWENEGFDEVGMGFLDGNTASWITSFRVRTEKMPELLKGLEEIGFTGLSQQSMEWGYEEVSQGIKFCFSPEDGWAGDDSDIEHSDADVSKTEYLKNRTDYYNVIVDLSVSSVYYPVKYADLIENHIGSAFFVQNIICGGYLEYISLRGGHCEGDSPYAKEIEIYFKDGSPLQMNLKMIRLGDGGSTPAVLFTEQEKESLVSLLAWMGGDGKASEEFVAGLGEKGDREGSIGSRKWYRIRDALSTEFTIRVQ